MPVLLSAGKKIHLAESKPGEDMRVSVGLVSGSSKDEPVPRGKTNWELMMTPA